MRTLIVCLLTLCATSAQAQEKPECPPALADAPAASTFGPYLITEWATTTAQASGLPTCGQAYAHLELLEQAAPGEVVSAIVAETDGTYTVFVSPQN